MIPLSLECILIQAMGRKITVNDFIFPDTISPVKLFDSRSHALNRKDILELDVNSP